MAPVLGSVPSLFQTPGSGLTRPVLDVAGIWGEKQWLEDLSTFQIK